MVKSERKKGVPGGLLMAMEVMVYNKMGGGSDVKDQTRGGRLPSATDQCH